ncbi:MAG: cytochrome b/b6 domain-containing protein [Halobacteriota archaeon]
MSDGHADSGGLVRFTGVQVYVHFLLAASILSLLLTGLGITFGSHVGWIATLVGSDNLILVHVLVGVLLFVVLLYYAFYVLLGVATGDVATAWLPGVETVREAVAYAKWAVGAGPEPTAGKYTWIQKSEILIISAESIVLVATGLVLTFPGLLLAYKPSFLIVSDVHAVVAYTLLMGVTYHLWDTHMVEFPLDESMFTGRVPVERAREEWADWVGDGRVAADGGSTGGRTPQVVGAIGVLGVFAVVYSGIVLERVLAPLPGTGETLLFDLEPGALMGGSLGFVWTIGLNLVAIVLLAGLLALFYGLTLRLTGDTQP